jgi:hypothetical protein
VGSRGKAAEFGSNIIIRRIAFAATMIFAVWVGSIWSAVPPQNAQAIIASSVQANAADWKAAPEYDFTERDLQPDGGSKTFEVMMIDGSPYERSVAVNQKPLPADQQEQEQKKLDATIAERRGESQQQRADRIAKYQKDRQRDHALMEQLTKAFDFTLIGERKLNGYDVYVLRAKPRAGYEPPSTETRVLTGMEGQLWIDKKTSQWVKIEAEVIHPVSIAGFLARVEPGTRFELEKMPVDNGIWLTKHFSMRAHARILSMFRHNSSEDESYSDYHKAGSDQGSSGSSQ